MNLVDRVQIVDNILMFIFVKPVVLEFMELTVKIFDLFLKDAKLFLHLVLQSSELFVKDIHLHSHIIEDLSADRLVLIRYLAFFKLDNTIFKTGVARIAQGFGWYFLQVNVEFIDTQHQLTET